jgi:hypothetical protein
MTVYYIHRDKQNICMDCLQPLQEPDDIDLCLDCYAAREMTLARYAN